MKYKIMVFMLVFSQTALRAQEKLNKLEAPSSPASSILSLQPTTVLSPKSYQALETALYSNFLNSEDNVIVPNDFALEFTPYWTKNHGLSLEEYLYPKSAFDQLVRNSSFSVASTQKFLLGDSSATSSLAFGYRTTFYIGNRKDREIVEKYKTNLRENQTIQTRIVTEAELLSESNEITGNYDFLERIKDTITKAIYESGKCESMNKAEELTNNIYKEAASLPTLDKSKPLPFLDSLYGLIDKHLNANALFNKFKTYVTERYGFTVDVAYANIINFPANNFEFSYVPRQSFWITPAYRFKDNWSVLKVMGTFRYEWYNMDYYKQYFADINIYKNNIDYGLALSTVFKRFSLQFELVGRYSSTEIPAGTDSKGNELYRKDQNSDLQYIGSFKYNLTNQIVVSYSLGNRFEPIQNPENTLVSILSLNIGFGTPTTDDLDL